ELFRRVVGNGVATAGLARAWADSCGRAVQWLRDAGVEVTIDPRTGQHWLEHESRVALRPVYRQDVGTKVLAKLRDAFLASGGTFWPATKALALCTSRTSAVDGLTVQRNGAFDQINSRAVILATGGFSANQEMLSRYVGRRAGECKVRGSSSDTGDGLRMALEAGAAAVNLSYFYGHLQPLKALADDRFWPYPRLDDLVLQGILVDGAGLRFVDEGQGDVFVSNALAAGSDPRGACLIFDQQTWDAAASTEVSSLAQLPGPNPWLKDNDGDLYEAATAEQLATLLEISGANLNETIEQVNAAVEGRGVALKVPRTGRLRALKAPFYGLRVVPGITFTMGGVRIDGQARVLNLDGLAIEGLYAVGDAIGGLMGGLAGGYTGGLSQAVVTALLAGESATQLAALH
ncbi:MAG: FAD-binding protein, partial [Chloroflexota bacterium]|nr:FAD-binding protein [Chloroflexota bacterium]